MEGVVVLKEPLLRPGKFSILNFVSRDVAEDDKRALERDVNQLTKLAEERLQVVSSRDEQINELKNTG